jgi:hypothetical protein
VSQDRDVGYILEFANAQLLELRMYDGQLDARLRALYDRVAAARTRRRPRLSGRVSAGVGRPPNAGGRPHRLLIVTELLLSVLRSTP